MAEAGKKEVLEEKWQNQGIQGISEQCLFLKHIWKQFDCKANDQALGMNRMLLLSLLLTLSQKHYFALYLLSEKNSSFMMVLQSLLNTLCNYPEGLLVDSERQGL